MVKCMSFNEWMYSVHKITPEMYEKRSEQIKEAIKDEYEIYKEDEKNYDEYDLVTQLHNLECKLLEKKEKLEQIKFTNDDKRKKKLKSQIANLERRITNKENEIECENAYELLADIGVPFDPNGEPLGIGDD